MITVTETKIKNIPILEVVKEDEKNEDLPLVIFYHGWTSCKESVLVHGYELAKRGFRAILPDALYHGERKKSLNDQEAVMEFWPIIVNSLNELPEIKEHYKKMYQKEPKIGVAGLSMGGMTVSALLTKYDWIKAATIQMGSIDPSGFSRWLVQSQEILEASNEQALKDTIDLDQLYQQLDMISLAQQPESIDGRPVHFWHGTNDAIVPFAPTFEFYEQIKEQPFANKVDFSVTKGGSHHVPHKEKVDMALFFEKNLN